MTAWRVAPLGQRGLVVSCLLLLTIFQNRAAFAVASQGRFERAAVGKPSPVTRGPEAEGVADCSVRLARRPWGPWLGPLGPPRLRKCQPSEKVHVAFPYLEPLFRPSHYVFLLWVKH